jgi:hypothetical protein
LTFTRAVGVTTVGVMTFTITVLGVTFTTIAVVDAVVQVHIMVVSGKG